MSRPKQRLPATYHQPAPLQGVTAKLGVSPRVVTLNVGCHLSHSPSFSVCSWFRCLEASTGKTVMVPHHTNGSHPFLALACGPKLIHWQAWFSFHCHLLEPPDTHLGHTHTCAQTRRDSLNKWFLIFTKYFVLSATYLLIVESKISNICFNQGLTPTCF